MSDITVAGLAELYTKYQAELRVAREQQREFRRSRPAEFRAQLDDIEAEITYLLVREHAPQNMVEIGTFHGWSTSWILRALRDNGAGRLWSFDIVDNVVRNIPAELSADRWTFTRGDIRQNLGDLPERVDYLFIDAAHNATFARWFIGDLFPLMPAGIPVSVHDVFHNSFAMPFSEGAVLMRWIRELKVDWFTASRKRAPEAYTRLTEHRAALGLTEAVHDGTDNPMVYFHLPATAARPT
jgi:predicted O-methyltransferase YrrM